MAEIYNMGQYRYTGEDPTYEKIYGTYSSLGKDDKSARLKPLDRLSGVTVNDKDTYYRDVLISLSRSDEEKKPLTSNEVYFIELEIAGAYIADTDYTLKLVDSNNVLKKNGFETVKRFTVSKSWDSALKPIKVVFYSDPDVGEGPSDPASFTLGVPQDMAIRGINNLLEPGYENKYIYRNEMTLLPSWVMDVNDYLKYKYSTAITTRYYEELFDSLLLEIDRTSDDADMLTLLDSGEYLLGRWLNVSEPDATTPDHLDVNLYKINNLVEEWAGSGQSIIIKKIGVWGRPGLKMFINNEEIQIGPSGVFEFEGIDITSFGVFANGENDKFVVDYQYVIVEKEEE